MSRPISRKDVEQVEKVMDRLNVLTNGGSNLLKGALQDAHLAMMQHGAASLTSYGKATKQVRERTRKRLEKAARTYFLCVMATEDSLKNLT
jgi:hypothetical protein